MCECDSLLGVPALEVLGVWVRSIEVLGSLLGILSVAALMC